MPESIAATATGEHVPSASLLSGRDVVLLEDNLIVALEAEEILRDLGARTVQALSSVAAAQAVMQSHKIGFAVLDINLGFETSFAFSAALRDADVPFIFTSVYGEGRSSSGAAPREMVVAKPYDRESLSVAIRATLAR